MQDMASTYVQSDSPNDNYFSVVSDLVSLAANIRASIAMLEMKIARELPSSNLESYNNIVLLDDITPRYLRVNTALHACQTQLGLALHCLQDIDSRDADASDLRVDRLAGHNGGLAIRL